MLCSIFIGILLLLIVICGVLSQRISIKERYIFYKKIRNIDWKWIFKLWGIIQASMIFAHLDKLKENLSIIITTPLMLVIVLLVFFLFSYDQKARSRYLKDETVLKSFERDEKLKKILK